MLPDINKKPHFRHMQLKPPSGHLGQRSPRKKRTINMLDDLSPIKLRSPMKRTMNELDHAAVQRAMQIRFKSIVPDYDDDNIDEDRELIEDEDMALADKIIALSKRDDYEAMHVESDDCEKDENMISEKDESMNLEKNEDTGNIFQRAELSMTPSLKRYLSKTNKEQSPSLSPSPTPTPTPTPTRKYFSRHYTPRKSNSRIESLVTDDVKFKSKVKLMEIPKIDKENDTLLKEDNRDTGSLFYDGFEGYFEQQKLKAKKLSSNSMTMAPQLSYDEFHAYNELLSLMCSKQKETLIEYYRQQYTQWLFELEEGFNLIFYGVGSKRRLILDFVQNFLLKRVAKNTKCIVANGYNSELHPRILLKCIWKSVFNKKPPTWHMVDSVKELKSAFNRYVDKRRLIIVLHNIDGESLRNDKYHYILSELCQISQISLICSMDNMSTPLFWNASLIANFNFIWHNITTFAPYTTEISFKDPLSIGKSDEFVGSKGAKYVLSSLTSNAKNLYKNLLIQQLEKIDSSLTSDEEIENRGSFTGNVKSAIVFRDFYEFCVNEFIVSNEISFRTVLREFVEHKMCALTRDIAGTEILYIPFTVNEMEKILEDELLE